MTGYPLLDLFLTMLYFFVWILWIFLVIRIIIDIFASHDISGWAKAGWLIFIVILPFIGVLVYLIARGHHMAERQAKAAQAQDEAVRKYVRDASGSGSGGSADQLAKLAELRDKGALSEAEFQQGKAKILG
ncbi:MAG: SHOCT domain-containing protein [Streptosporangiaceae bacterium]